MKSARTIGVCTAVLLSGLFAQSALAAPPLEVIADAYPAQIVDVRGFVRWQPREDAAWQTVKRDTDLPLRGRIAVGIGSVLVLKHMEKQFAFDAAGVFDLKTRRRENYQAKPIDPPGVRTMTSAPPEVLKLNNAANGIAVVIAFKGAVQWRPSKGTAWQRVSIGLEVPLGAEIRTGLRSNVVLKQRENTMAIDRLGIVTLRADMNGNGRIKTDLGLKYGRTNYRVQAAGEEFESKTHAPSTKLPTRGQRITVSDD